MVKRAGGLDERCMLSKNNINIKKILRELPLFAELAPEHLGKLARTSRSATFQRDQAIYRVGDPASEMYILLSGQVKLTLSCNQGNEKIIDVIEAGRSFGEAELFGTHPYLACAMAVKPSQLLCIAGGNLWHAMAMDPRVALRIMKVLAHRQIEMEADAVASYCRSNSQRLLDFFLSQAGPNRDLLGETMVTLCISKQLLASRFDMQPETLSRTLRNLTEAGLIAVDGRRIRLKNVRISRYLANDASAQTFIFQDRRRLSQTGGNGYAGIASGSGAERRNTDFRPFCDSINKAGRQRMLSQRMAKSWLMLEQGILSRRARIILKQSVDMFDNQLKELDMPSNSVESCAARAELSDVWRPYRTLLNSKPSRKGARQLFGMSEEVLAAAQKLTLSFVHADSTRQGKLVNLAGRERMLSQRMVKFFMFQHMGIQVPKCRAELESVSEEFSTALGVLASATHDKPRITAELDRVAGQWKALQSAMAIQDGADFISTSSKVFTKSEHLLRRMDRAVEFCVRLTG